MPAGQVKFFGEFKLQIYNPAHQIFFFRAVKETLRLVHARYSLPKWQTVKLTFFTPWVPLQIGGNPHHPKMNQIPHKKTLQGYCFPSSSIKINTRVAIHCKTHFLKGQHVWKRLDLSQRTYVQCRIFSMSRNLHVQH